MSYTLRRLQQLPSALSTAVFRAFGATSLKAKLFAFAGVIILLMASLALFTRIQVNSLQNVHIPARTLILEMETSLLNMRIYEQQLIAEANTPGTTFYLKQESSNTIAWQENYQKFESSYNQLLERYKETNIDTQLQQTHNDITAYRDAFLALVSTYQQRGFQNYGREGALLQRANTLTANLAGNAQAAAAFARLQQSHTNFLLYHEPRAEVEFATHAATLRPLVSGSNQTILQEYVTLFNEVVALQRKIGLTQSEGLRSTLSKATSVIDPRIQNIELDVLAISSKQITAIPRSIDLIAVIITLLALSVAYLLTHYINKRIRLLLDASKQVSKGNYHVQLQVDTQDELGRLAVSFNSMTAQLAQNHTSLRQHAKDLAQSVQRFELVSRAVNEAIYERELEKGSLSWGKGVSSVFGYHNTKQTTIDWWTDRIHPDDAEEVNDSLSASIRRRAAKWQHEYRFRRATGQYVYCQDRGFIEYKNRQPIRMVGSMIDITRQKELDRAKDEFISVASHQLRTPLGSIRWNLELLLTSGKKLSKDVHDYADEAYNSTLRMLGLVSDLLSVARIEQNRVKDIPDKTDLSEIVLMAVNEMKPIAQQRRVPIDTTSLRKREAVVNIDPKRFREVIQNLLSNAVKYTEPKGRVSIHLETRAKDFVISIADNGIGIPLEDHRNLFNKFFRASNVTITDTEGSGLGLYVVKSYIESWGGHIWFDSVVGKGTTFYVTIPHKPRPQEPRIKERTS